MRPFAISIMRSPSGAAVVRVVDEERRTALLVTGETRRLAIAAAVASPHVADDIKTVLENLGGAGR